MYEPIGFEYNCRFRPVRRDGRTGSLNWRFFPNAAACLSFLASLDNPSAPQILFLTVARRPLGAWQPLDRHELEALAAEEADR